MSDLYLDTDFRRETKDALRKVAEKSGEPYEKLAKALAGMQLLLELCFDLSFDSGWWDRSRNKGEMLMLIVSEVAEAMEGERKNLADDHLPHRQMAEVELADAIIRVGDYAGGWAYDVTSALIEKLAYNMDRADHKRENRAKPGGKAF